MKKDTHKIIILKADAVLGEKATAVLSDAGYTVRNETSPSNVLSIMKSETSLPVSLLIYSFAMSKQFPPGFLEEIKAISPMTQKMIIIPSDQPDKLIEAINKGEINSSISFPFQDRDLISQTENCCQVFANIMKQIHLKSIMKEQNKKLYKYAQKLKQKNTNHKAIIDKKRKIVLNLKKHLQKDIKDTVSHLLSNPENKNELPELFTLIPENDQLNEFFEIGVTHDQLLAYLKVIKDPESEDERKENFTLSKIIQFHNDCGVVFGLIADTKIEEWLLTSNTSSKPIITAAGIAPVPGTPATIKYYFSSDYTNAGKISEDGTIDFRERGDVPFIDVNTLLAEKQPGIDNIPGTSISNTSILPMDIEDDPELIEGPGTRISEDGTRIYSTMEGLPLLDKSGCISVVQELHIDGDVNYQTGNINFPGNILVSGIVRDGFQVKGISLTATQIEGGKIELTENLYVLDGILNSDINAAGSVEVKYVHNSNIEGFCDVHITQETIDSTINISGMFKSGGGRIINSTVIANCGIEAGNIGSDHSRPCKLTFGINNFVKQLIKNIDPVLKNYQNDIIKLENQIKELEGPSADLLEKTTKAAQIHERLQLEYNRLIEQLSRLNSSEDDEQIKVLEQKIEYIKKIIDDANEKSKIVFDAQEKNKKQMEHYIEKKIDMEKTKKELLKEKTILEDKLNSPAPDPQIIVYKKIFTNTLITSRKASTILKTEQSRCTIQEKNVNVDGKTYAEINIQDLKTI